MAPAKETHFNFVATTPTPSSTSTHPPTALICPRSTFSYIAFASRKKVTSLLARWMDLALAQVWSGGLGSTKKQDRGKDESSRERREASPVGLAPNGQGNKFPSALA